MIHLKFKLSRKQIAFSDKQLWNENKAMSNFLYACVHCSCLSYSHRKTTVHIVNLLWSSYTFLDIKPCILLDPFLNLAVELYQFSTLTDSHCKILHNDVRPLMSNVYICLFYNGAFMFVSRFIWNFIHRFNLAVTHRLFIQG